MMTPPTATAIARHEPGAPMSDDEAERRWADLDPRQREKLAALEAQVRALNAQLGALQERRRDVRDQIARDEHELADVQQARDGGRYLEPDKATGKRVLPEPRPAVVARQARLQDEEAHVVAEIATTTEALHAARAVAQACRKHLQLPRSIG